MDMVSESGPHGPLAVALGESMGVNLQRLITQHRQHLLVSDLPQLLVAEPHSDRGHTVLQLCDRVLHQHHDRDLTHDHFA